MVEGVAQTFLPQMIPEKGPALGETLSIINSPRLIPLGRATGKPTWDSDWKALKLFFKISFVNNSKEPFKCNYLGQERQFKLNGPDSTPSYSIGSCGCLLFFLPKTTKLGRKEEER